MDKRRSGSPFVLYGRAECFLSRSEIKEGCSVGLLSSHRALSLRAVRLLPLSGCSPLFVPALPCCVCVCVYPPPLSSVCNTIDSACVFTKQNKTKKNPQKIPVFPVFGCGSDGEEVLAAGELEHHRFLHLVPTSQGLKIQSYHFHHSQVLLYYNKVIMDKAASKIWLA